MSKSVNKTEFTDIGELIDTPEYGLVIKLPFGKALSRVVGRLMGLKLEVSFKPLKYQRSNAQNRWLWGVAYPTIAAWIRETSGELVNKEAIHAHTLQEILGYTPKSKTVNNVEVIYMEGKSTKALNTQEFNDLKDNLQKYYSELGCDVPDPRGNNYLSDYLDD